MAARFASSMSSDTNPRHTQGQKAKAIVFHGHRPQSWVADAILALVANGSQMCQITRSRPSNAEGHVVRPSRRNVVERTDHRQSFVFWLRGFDSRPTRNIPFRLRTVPPR
jgi:hypothetical protein